MREICEFDSSDMKQCVLSLSGARVPDADGASETVESIISEAMKAAKVIRALSPTKEGWSRHDS